MSKIVDDFVAQTFAGQVEGTVVNPGNMGEPREFARQLGLFIYRLHHLEVLDDAPKPDFENAFAGSDLRFFEAEFLDQLKTFQKLVPADMLAEKFEHAAKSTWQKAPVWVHGDLTPKNLRVADGKLVGVVSADKAVVGDPACDLALAWTLFDDKTRKIFFRAVDADERTVERARMLALRAAFKNYNSDDIDELIQSRDAMTEILKDFDYSAAPDMY